MVKQDGNEICEHTEVQFTGIFLCDCLRRLASFLLGKRQQDVLYQVLLVWHRQQQHYRVFGVGRDLGTRCLTTMRNTYVLLRFFGVGRFIVVVG